MKHLFIPYELALQLKEKGFDYPTFGYYGDSQELRLERFVSKDDVVLKAPLYQQVTDWFRERHNLLICVDSAYFSFEYPNDKHQFYPKIVKWMELKDIKEGEKTLILSASNSKEYDDYYKAYNEVIKEALKLI